MSTNDRKITILKGALRAVADVGDEQSRKCRLACDQAAPADCLHIRQMRSAVEAFYLAARGIVETDDLDAALSAVIRKLEVSR